MTTKKKVSPAVEAPAAPPPPPAAAPAAPHPDTVSVGRVRALLARWDEEIRRDPSKESAAAQLRQALDG